MSRILAVVSLLAVIAAATFFVLRGGADGPGGSGGDPTTTVRPGTDSVVAGVAEPEAVPEPEAIQANRREVERGHGQVQLTWRLIDREGRPLPGVQLDYTRIRGNPAMWRSIPGMARVEPASTTETDSGGRFELFIDAAEKGSVSIARAADLLFATDDQRVSIPGYHADRDLGDLEVRAAARIAGTVVDAQGRAVAGARVSARSRRSAPFFLGSGSAESTDEAGRFSVGGLVAGRYRLTAVVPGRVPAELDVDLEPGERRLDVGLTIEAGASIAGKVVDERGAGIAGAKVAAKRERDFGQGMSYETIDPHEAVETDGSGRFELGGLVADTVEIQVWADGHERVTRKDVAVGTRNLIVTLERRAVITGVVLDPDGRPIAGCPIYSRPPDQRSNQAFRVVLGADGATSMRFSSQRDKTDENGRFELRVKPGRLIVVADSDEHLKVESEVLEVAAGDRVDDLQLVARPGATLTTLVLDPRGDPVEGARVEVREPREQRHSHEGDFVAALDVGGDHPIVMSHFAGSSLGDGTTDQDGRTVIRGLPPGSGDVTAEHDDFVPTTPTPVQLAIDVPAQARLVVRPGGYVAVSVRDHTGEPLAEASFEVTGPLGTPDDETTESSTTDGEGASRVGPLPPGRYSATLRLPARKRATGGVWVLPRRAGGALENTRIEFEIIAGETTDVALEQPILTTVTGVVSDGARPARDVVVAIRKAGSPPNPFSLNQASARTDADGRYTVEALEAGDYTIEFGRDRAPVKHRQPLTIAAGLERIDRDLLLETGTLRLRVIDGDGEPVERATVSVRRPADANPTGVFELAGDYAAASSPLGGGRVRTDEDGVAAVPDLPRGSFEVVVSHQRYVDRTLESIDIVPGVAKDLGDLALDAAGSIAGAVAGTESLPFGQVQVLAAGAEKPVKTAMVMQGKFRVRGLEPGQYRVRARAGTDGAWGVAVTVTVAAGQTTNTDLRAGARD